MCFGGCGTGLGNCTGSIAYILEKLASFIAMTAVILCIVMTVTISLGLGIGLGYNYCFVDLKILKDTDVASNDITITTSTEPTTLPELVSADWESSELPEQTYADAQRMPPRPRRTLPMPVVKHTISIPLHEEFDFPALLSILRGRNKNVTLEFITT